MKTIATALMLLCLMSCKKEGQLLTKDPKGATAARSLSPTGGTIYYIDPAGNDSSAGTDPATAWQTIAKVNSVVFSPGDQLLFKAGGTWSGNLKPQGSGTSAAPIIIDQYGTGGKPVINGGGVANGSATVLLNRQSFWEINNLEVTNTVPGGLSYAVTGIKVAGADSVVAASHIYIKNCYVHDVNAAVVGTPNYQKGSGGIIISGTFNDVLVQSCHIANCQIEGIRTTSSTNLSTNIIFDNNLIENIYGDGIVLSSVSGGSKITGNTVYNACMSNAINFAGVWTIYSTNSLVAYNEVYGMTGGGPNDGTAFDADLGTNGDIFEYNYSHDNNGGFFLFMSPAKNITVRYNVSANDVGTSGQKKLFLTEATTNTSRQIYNNVFYLKNVTDKLFWGKPVGLFANNIFYTTSTVTNFSDKTLDANSKFYNNCFYPSASILTTNWGGGDAQRNILSNPQFVNASGYGTGRATASGFNIQSASPCINGGLYMSNNGGIDFEGDTLLAARPDVGAFQHAVTVTSYGSFADAFVRNGTYAGNNYGTAVDLTVKADALSYARKSYLKFDFTGVSASSLSAAVLKLYASAVNTSPSRTISVYTTNTESWAETGITWNNAPMDTVYVGKITVTGVGAYSIDVTDAINRQLTFTDRIVSFLLINNGAADSKGDASFSSREAVANKPGMDLQY